MISVDYTASLRGDSANQAVLKRMPIGMPINTLLFHGSPDILIKYRSDFFTATTDLWSSDSCHPYLTLTIHFISTIWDLKSLYLDTAALYEDHTGHNIADAISDIFEN